MAPKTRKPKEPTVEIARSFTFKVNVKNHLSLEQLQYLDKKNMAVDYESHDFFASQKFTCPASKAEEMSEAAFQFCKGQVVRGANALIAEYRKLATPPREIDLKKIADEAKTESQLDVL